MKLVCHIFYVMSRDIYQFLPIDKIFASVSPPQSDWSLDALHGRGCPYLPSPIASHCYTQALFPPNPFTNMSVSRLQNVPGIGVDVMGNAADAAHDPDILRLENMDTD